jgi:hypothetical protein
MNRAPARPASCCSSARSPPCRRRLSEWGRIRPSTPRRCTSGGGRAPPDSSALPSRTRSSGARSCRGRSCARRSTSSRRPTTGRLRSAFASRGERRGSGSRAGASTRRRSRPRPSAFAPGSPTGRCGAGRSTPCSATRCSRTASTCGSTSCASALGYLGAPPRRPLRARRALARAAGGEGGGGARATRAALSRGLRPRSGVRIANWAGLPAAEVTRTCERLELRRLNDERGGELLDLPDAPLPDPETPAPVRFLPDLGRLTTGARAPHRHPARGAPPEGLQHKDPAVRPDLPGRRTRRGRVALRARRDAPRAVRAPRPRDPHGARGGGRGASRAAPLTLRRDEGPPCVALPTWRGGGVRGSPLS